MSRWADRRTITMVGDARGSQDGRHWWRRGAAVFAIILDWGVYRLLRQLWNWWRRRGR